MFAETLSIQKIPVLLVEDSRSEAHVMQRQLESIDDEFDIRRVSRLDEALASLEQEKTSAVILDLGLPDSDGPLSVKTLRQSFPDMPIVVLSGRDDENTIRRSLQYGAQEFVGKANSTGKAIRQAIMGAIIRKSLKT